MHRKYTILVAVLFFTFQASASLFGTFPQQIEKQSDDLSTEISIGVINAGSSELTVRFSSPENEEYNISLPGPVTVQPSEVTSNPEGEGWYYLGNNEYARYEEFSFDVEISQYRKDNTVNVPLTVIARSTTQEGTAPISRIREYNYTVLLNPNLRPLDREGNVQEEPLYWEEEDSSVPEEWRESSNSTEPQNSSGAENNESEDYKASQEEELTGETGDSTFTLALVAGIVLTIAYIMKVT